jgi:hypothetical protein
MRQADRTVAQGLAVGFVAMWGLSLPVVAGVSTSSLAVLASAPIWITAVQGFRWGWRLLLVSAVAALNGAMLALAHSGARPISDVLAIAQILQLVAGIGGIGLVLWARREMSSRQVAVVVAFAMLLGSTVNISGSPNPWKYFISAPLTLLILAALDRRRGFPTVAALLLLALIGIATNSRSYAGFCILTLGLLVLQRMRTRGSTGWAKRVGTLALGATLLWGGYQLASSLMVSGYLGAEAQARSEQQIALGGSLIGGGRPEWSGTLELARANPAGFGVGAVPTYEDIWTARVGLAEVGVDVDNGYVEHFMFGRSFKLHSVTADLWSQFGITGVLLALLLLAAVVLSLVERFLAGTAAPFLLFLGTKAVWDLAFSPSWSALPWVGLAIGLVLLRREESEGPGPRSLRDTAIAGGEFASAPTASTGPPPGSRGTGRCPEPSPGSPS